MAAKRERITRFNPIEDAGEQTRYSQGHGNANRGPAITSPSGQGICTSYCANNESCTIYSAIACQKLDKTDKKCCMNDAIANWII
jgi:hypothetical protein